MSTLVPQKYPKRIRPLEGCRIDPGCYGGGHILFTGGPGPIYTLTDGDEYKALIERAQDAMQEVRSFLIRGRQPTPLVWDVLRKRFEAILAYLEGEQ